MVIVILIVILYKSTINININSLAPTPSARWIGEGPRVARRYRALALSPRCHMPTCPRSYVLCTIHPIPSILDYSYSSECDPLLPSFAFYLCAELHYGIALPRRLRAITLIVIVIHPINIISPTTR